MDDFCKVNRWEQLKHQLNNVSVAEYPSFMEQHPDIALLDCRRPEEYAVFHLAHSQNIDYFGDGFYEDLDALDKDKSYLVYCRSGRRSLRVCTLMKNSGFSSVYNLSEGLNGFEDLPK